MYCIFNVNNTFVVYCFEEIGLEETCGKGYTYFIKTTLLSKNYFCFLWWWAKLFLIGLHPFRKETNILHIILKVILDLDKECIHSHVCLLIHCQNVHFFMFNHLLVIKTTPMCVSNNLSTMKRTLGHVY